MPHGGVCPESIDFAKRVSADIELSLSQDSQQKSNPETRAMNFRNAAKLIVFKRRRESLGYGKKKPHSNPRLLYNPSLAQKPRHTNRLHRRI